MTKKLPPPQRLPPRYGVVTSNTSECINSMIDDYRSEGWTDLLKGTLDKMTERISEKKQLYKMEQGGDVVAKVKQILKYRFQSAVAMKVVKLEVVKECMVMERRGAMLKIHNRHQLQWSTSIRTRTCFFCQFRGEQNQIYLQLKRRHVLVGSDRNTSILSGMLWHTSGNGKPCHFLLSCRCMCMTITRTMVCNKCMHITFPHNMR